MEFAFTEDQRAIQALARNFAQEEFIPYALDWDENKIFPIETMRKAAGLGFGGIYVRDEVGGSALSRFDGALLFEELAQGCPSTTAYLTIHNMVGWLVENYGNTQQRQDWLPKLCSMAWMSSYCLTEPNSGSDAAALKTRAVRDGDQYIINGSKSFVSGGGVSDFYAVMVRTGDDRPDGISCIAIEKGTPGLSFGKLEKKMGWNSQPTAMVMFDDCRVPVTNLLGAEGQGFKIAMSALDGGRINIAACSLGGAQRCLDKTKQYMDERKQFGKKLNEFEALQFRFADMATELDAARLMVHRAALSLDHKSADATLHCAMAKRYATDIGFRVVNEALQLHGGYGYLQDYEIERYLRDLRVHQILEGTNEIMRLIIARKLLKD
jgi:isobutyryl-CoA dehydrogenase